MYPFIDHVCPGSSSSESAWTLASAKASMGSSSSSWLNLVPSRSTFWNNAWTGMQNGVGVQLWLWLGASLWVLGMQSTMLSRWESVLVLQILLFSFVTLNPQRSYYSFAKVCLTRWVFGCCHQAAMKRSMPPGSFFTLVIEWMGLRIKKHDSSARQITVFGGSLKLEQNSVAGLAKSLQKNAVIKLKNGVKFLENLFRQTTIVL